MENPPEMNELHIPESPPRIEGKGIVLRQIQESDIDERLTIGNDREKHRMYGGVSDEFEEWTPESQRAWYEKELKDPTHWTIEHDGKYLGILRIHNTDSKEGSAWIGLGVDDKSQRGKGLGTEAIRLASEWAFKEAGIKVLRARVLDFNSTSQRAFEKAGYRKYDEVPTEIAGKQHTDYLYELKSDD